MVRAKGGQGEQFMTQKHGFPVKRYKAAITAFQGWVAPFVAPCKEPSLQMDFL
jgi:hypothetical protein